jgi:hypothetical protein
MLYSWDPLFLEFENSIAAQDKAPTLSPYQSKMIYAYFTILPLIFEFLENNKNYGRSFIT